MALLNVENLRTYFYLGNKVLKAVDGISIKIEEGESLAIVGESGSGKSVTCRSILGIQYPGKIVEGKVFFRDINLLELSFEAMRRIRGNQISMIFQNPITSLNQLSTIGSQIEDQVLAHQDISKKIAKDKILESFSQVGIKREKEMYSKYPCELSDAIIQQIMVAAAIVCNPKLILADEPTSNLGIIGQANVLNSLRDVKKNLRTSIIIVTHDFGIAAQFSDNIFVMYGGTCVEYGIANKILRYPKHPYTVGLIDSVIEIDTSNTSLKVPIPGDPIDLIDPPKGCPFYPRCEKHMENCKLNKPHLIEVGKNHYCACFLYYH